MSDNALEELSNLGFNPQYGARPVKRAMQTYILNELSKAILSEKVNSSDIIKIDFINQKFVFENQK